MNLYMDAETIPDQEEGALENARELVKVPANYKKPEAIENYRLQHAAEAYEKTSLNGIAGEICSISWALDDADIRGMIRHPGDSEADMLQAFFTEIRAVASRDGEGGFPRLTWVGHNIIDFDLRFILQRCMVNNVIPPFRIPADARHGSDQVFDTMRAWAGWKGYVSQDALVKAFKIEVPETGVNSVDGSQVWPMYQAGKFQDILEYNKLDVWRVRELHKRMSWL